MTKGQAHMTELGPVRPSIIAQPLEHRRANLQEELSGIPAANQMTQLACRYLIGAGAAKPYCRN
jgi:hypothetical protein